MRVTVAGAELDDAEWIATQSQAHGLGVHGHGGRVGQETVGQIALVQKIDQRFTGLQRVRRRIGAGTRAADLGFLPPPNKSAIFQGRVLPGEVPVQTLFQRAGRPLDSPGSAGCFLDDFGLEGLSRSVLGLTDTAQAASDGGLPLPDSRDHHNRVECQPGWEYMPRHKRSQLPSSGWALMGSKGDVDR